MQHQEEEGMASFTFLAVVAGREREGWIRWSVINQDACLIEVAFAVTAPIDSQEFEFWANVPDLSAEPLEMRGSVLMWIKSQALETKHTLLRHLYLLFQDAETSIGIIDGFMDQGDIARSPRMQFYVSLFNPGLGVA